MDVSVIIVNYNTFQLTRQCIDSVFAVTSGISFEVILVDNASSDNSKHFFVNDNRITYIYSETNLGFGKANNLGVEVANGRNIIFLNSDTLLMNNAIKILSDFLDRNICVGACGGNLYNGENKPIHSYYKFLPSLYRDIFGGFISRWQSIIRDENYQFNHTKRPLQVKHITGADLMVKRSVLNELGQAFAPEFFMYYEDDELCYRIGKKYKLYSVPEANIKHLVGSSRDMKAFSSWQIKGKDTYYKLVGHGILYRKLSLYFKILILYIAILKNIDTKKKKVLRETLFNYKNYKLYE